MNYQKSIFIFILLSLYSINSIDFPEEEGVLVLGDSNIDEAIKTFNYILIDFYAPWCGHCKTLAPEYAAAAQQLKAEGSEIKLAKVDATEHPNSGAKFKVGGYPTLFYIVKGKQFNYSGPRQKDGIIEWVKKKTLPPSKELSSIRAAESYVNAAEGDYVLLFVGTKGFDSYLNLANQFEEVEFAHCSIKECLDYYKAKDGSILLFRTFDNKRSELKAGFGLNELERFINREGTPLVIKYDKKYENLIVKNKVPSLYFYHDSDSNELPLLKKVAAEVAPKIKNLLQVVLVDVSNPAFRELNEFIGFPYDSLPDVRIADSRVRHKVYKLSSREDKSITTENVLKFVGQWERNEIKSDLKSEPLPAEQGAVVKLVGYNFKEIVYDKTKDVFVKYHTPTCGHCKRVAPTWIEFAEKIKKGGNPNIVIAEIDTSLNEYGFMIGSFPSFFLYKADGENTEVIYDEKERTVESFIGFIKKNAVNKLVLNEDL